MTRPLLFLDVDGVLNREVSNSQARKRGLRSYSVTASDGWRYRLHLDLGDRTRLQRLRGLVDLAWVAA